MTSAIDGQDKPVLRPKEIAERIERDIHVGTLAPGAWLKQVDLEERYGCTRIDLRQALDRLVTRQLVRHTPNRGYRVDEFEPRKVEELSWIRALLEAAIAEEVVARIDDAGIRELERRAQRFADLVHSGTLEEQDDANQAFHNGIFDHCGNSELIALIKELRRRLPVSIMRLKYAPSRIENSWREHFQMIEALRARDADAFKHVTAIHILEYHRRHLAEDIQKQTVRLR